MKRMISNRELVENAAALKSIYQKQFPVEIAYAIYKNTSKLDRALSALRKEKDKLLEHYHGTETDNVVNFEDKRNVPKWCEGIDALLNTKNEFRMVIFKLQDLGGVTFSGAEMAAIDCMIEK